MATLVDSNVIIDILQSDSEWRLWSVSRIEECASRGHLIINPLIYAELSYRFSSKELLDAALPVPMFRHDQLPWEAAYLAGRAFVEYRRRGGKRTVTLPDFFIGAHAEVANLPILTRDITRYQSYFPQVKLIAP